MTFYKSGTRLRLSPFSLLFITVMGCSSNKNEQAELEKFPVITPIVKDTTYTREYVAEIHSVQNVEIRAKANGYLESIHVDEGSIVNQGQVLFSLNSQQFKQELLKAQAALTSALAESKAAEVELKNTRTLVEKNVISQSELDLAQARYDALLAKIEEAKAEEANAHLQLSFTQIRAPFSGIINRIPNKAGSLIEEGTLLTTLSNNKEVFIYFNLSERAYLDYVSSAPAERPAEATLVLANNTVYPLKGKIETVESEFDQSTGNIAFRARFPNPNQILKHGGSGKILLTTKLNDAMLVPQKSTFEIQENIYVFLVDANNKVLQQRITPVARLPHWYVIAPSLTVNDKIIYEGIQKVKDGDAILPEPRSFSQITNAKN
jgi:membrane fusion protein (multidrug efflux system)